MVEAGATFEPLDSDNIGGLFTLRMISNSAYPQIAKAVNDINRQSKKCQIRFYKTGTSRYPVNSIIVCFKVRRTTQSYNN